MKKTKTGGQKSRLRVDPFTLTQLLCEQNTTLSAVQQAAGIDPAELEPLRTARKIPPAPPPAQKPPPAPLSRLAAGLKVSVYQLMITAQSPWTVHHGGSGSRRAVINRLSDHSPYDISPLFK